MWKKVGTEHFLIFSNIIALLIAVIAFISRSPLTLSFIQFLLLIAMIIISMSNHKEKKKSNIKALYLFIGIFWLLIMLVLSPVLWLPFEVKIFFQIISIIVFGFIYYKIHKWVR